MPAATAPRRRCVRQRPQQRPFPLLGLLLVLVVVVLAAAPGAAARRPRPAAFLPSFPATTPSSSRRSMQLLRRWRRLSAQTAVPPQPGCMEEEENAWVPRAVYVHLPFCRRRCYYCDFPIKVVGDGQGAADAASEEYVELLLRELKATISGGIDPRRIRAAGGLTSIFFGGGTPSLTPPVSVQRVVGALEEAFGLAEGAEISMEMDPGTFDGPRLHAFLHDCGVTRVSMGVQAFDAELLAACGRAHSLEDVHTAIATLEAANFENWSVDLIGGLPGQTMAQWESSVDAAIASGAAHVSVYDLQVEAGTAFGRWYGSPDDNEDDDNHDLIKPQQPQQQQSQQRRTTLTPLPQEEQAAEMYALASSKLRAAEFRHYELSNYAKTGHECRHNRVYWEGKPFLALGMGAASYVGWHRFARPRTMGEYRMWVALLEDGGWGQATGYDAAVKEWPAKQWAVERVEDLLMVGLRLREGVSLPRLLARSGLGQAVGENKARAVLREWEGAVVSRFVERGAAVYDHSDGWLALTDPEGLLVSNEVISEMYAAVARALEDGE